MDLNNKVALVTGGASGLGQATVEAYVAKGAKAVILDINEDKALEIINNLGEDKVMFISTDIMKEDPVVEAINKLKIILEGFILQLIVLELDIREEY